MKFQLISGRSRITFLAAKRIHAFGISAACGTLTEGIHVYFIHIHIHSKEGLAWFDRLVRSEWASLPYCITIALLSVACFPFSVFHVNMSICTTALYNGYVHNGIADSEVRLHQAATAGLQQHQDLKQGFLSEPMSGMLLLCWCWCGVVCFEELQIHPKVKVSCTTNKYTIQYGSSFTALAGWNRDTVSKSYRT